ncbi:hypothetical protein, partial [Fodinicola feengrottensis]|uniref:hypothetical protein n=1 Tax=Fodinicola feengrottensis TaxID=435914 RepID=UPI002441602C
TPSPARPEGKTAYDSNRTSLQIPQRHQRTRLDRHPTNTRPIPLDQPTGRTYDVTPNDEYPPPPF